MKCCKCKCSFKECIEERKETLTKEFQEMIANWMNEHPEVDRVWLCSKECFSSNYMTIHQTTKLEVSIHFE